LKLLGAAIVISASGGLHFLAPTYEHVTLRDFSDPPFGQHVFHYLRV
jgi:hypothetical protein